MTRQPSTCPTRFEAPRLIGSAVAAGAVVLALVGCAPASDDTELSITGYTQGSDVAAAIMGTAPAAFVPWLDDLPGALCDHPAVTADLVEAQLYIESGFDTEAVGAGGTLGSAQIRPDTWAEIGRDVDGNGVASPHDIGDAVGALVTEDCAIAHDLGPAAGPHDIAAVYTGGASADHPDAVAVADRVTAHMAARTTTPDGGTR